MISLDILSKSLLPLGVGDWLEIPHQMFEATFGHANLEVQASSQASISLTTCRIAVETKCLDMMWTQVPETQNVLS